jgi:hypothetical protein
VTGAAEEEGLLTVGDGEGGFLTVDHGEHEEREDKYGRGGHQVWGWERGVSTWDPSSGEGPPVWAGMVHFCWGNCLGTLYRLSTCNLGGLSPLLHVQIW